MYIPIRPSAARSLPANSPSRKGVKRRFEALEDPLPDHLAVGCPAAHMDAVIPCTCPPMSIVHARYATDAGRFGGQDLKRMEACSGRTPTVRVLRSASAFRGRTKTGGLPLGGARNVVRGSGGIPRPEVNVQR